MAEDIVLGLAKTVLGELGKYVAGEIQSAWLVKKDLQKLERSLSIICPFIEDAEKRQLSSAAIRQWVKELKHVVYKIDDLLDKATTDALRMELKQSGKVHNYLSYVKHKLISPFRLSNKIRRIRKRLDEIEANTSSLKLNVNLSGSLDVAQSSHHQITYALPNINRSNSIKGRDAVKSEILGKVLSNGVENCYGLSVLPIVGIGGLGKTTVAQLVYSDPAIEEEFDIKLWGCVSDPFKLDLVLKRLLESVKIKGLGEAEMVDELGRIVRDKRYFMVLDDVWTRNENEWNSLKDILACSGAKGGVILATTRDKGVATKTIGAKNYYELEKLPFEICRSLFIENAFGTGGEHERYMHLVEVGEAIVKKCGGIPLAVKALGSSLRGRRDEREWFRVVESELWNMEQKEGDILPALKLSYNALDSNLKSCFAYLSIYDKDDPLFAEEIIGMWIAQGLIKYDSTKLDELEDTGFKYLEELVSRSLLDDLGSTYEERLVNFEMHDLVHDLAMDVMGEELALVSCFNKLPNVSRFVRHMVWNSLNHWSDMEELPRQLQVGAQQVRTFKQMGLRKKVFVEHVISTFPCLRVLDLTFCDMEGIPDSIGKLKHLRYLKIYFSERIKELPNSICKLQNLQTLNVITNNRIRELPRGMGKLINLRYLAVTVQSQYLFPKGMMRFVNPPSLQLLRIHECNEMISLLPQEDEDDDALGKIRFLTQLRELDVQDCPKLSSLLSKSLVYLTSLKQLQIFDCESLDLQMELPPGPGLGGMMPSGLLRLERLDVSVVPKLAGLPDWLESAALSLRYLLIFDCKNLRTLPNWLRKCKFLLHLRLGDCPNLSSALPLEVLTNLQKLVIRGCPYMSLGCKEEDMEDWSPYISHIPCVHIEGINGHGDLFWEDGITK